MSKYTNNRNTHIDMTPFVDIAFLILTFFILVTNFKPDETIKITPPNSVSMEELKSMPNSITILFDSGGNVFVMLSREYRDNFLNQFYQKFGIALNPKAAKEFNKLGEINCSLASLEQFYAMQPEQRKDFTTGLDMADEVQDLYETISIIKSTSNDTPTIYIKGDNAAKYTVYKKVLKALTDNNIYNFNLVTFSEPIPAGSPLGIKLNTFNKNLRK